VLEDLITMPSFGGLDFAWTLPEGGGQNCGVFLLVCQFVCPSCSLTAKFERMTLPRRHWNLEVVLNSLIGEGLQLCIHVHLCLYTARSCHHRMLELKLL